MVAKHPNKNHATTMFCVPIVPIPGGTGMGAAATQLWAYGIVVWSVPISICVKDVLQALPCMPCINLCAGHRPKENGNPVIVPLAPEWPI
jgi:hypothetical protein